jgi:hypothetical protein
MVNISYFDSKYNYTDLNCSAVFQNRQYNSARDLLKASMKDKTFARNVSNALGFPVKMEETNWFVKSDIKSKNNGALDKERTPDLG